MYCKANFEYNWFLLTDGFYKKMDIGRFSQVLNLLKIVILLHDVNVDVRFFDVKFVAPPLGHRLYCPPPRSDLVQVYSYEICFIKLHSVPRIVS